MNRTIYLDYAAATPVDRTVLKAMEPYFTEQFFNPSASYMASRTVRQALGSARAQIAGLLGAKPAEIIFTAGATEANNLAITGLMRQFPDGEVMISAIEHESVAAPAGLFKVRQIPVTAAGLVEAQAVDKLITEQTVLISVMLVSNELGTIQPLREIAATVARARKLRQKAGNSRPLYLHTDAAQAANYLDIHVSRLGIDMMSLNGGKIYGPKQSGVLYVRAGLKLLPMIVGGGQEFGLRSGTENVPAAIGLGVALAKAQASREQDSRRLTGLREQFESQLKKQLPKAQINGSLKGRAPHIISLTLPGVDNERLMMQLDELGIQVATGSACSAGSDEPSAVLAAIGLSRSSARSTLRLSLGQPTTRPELNRVLEALTDLTAANR